MRIKIFIFRQVRNKIETMNKIPSLIKTIPNLTKLEGCGSFFHIVTIN